MSLLIVALLLFPGLQADAPAGRPDAGKTAWAAAPYCQSCHGVAGEGGFAPDLAGRGLTLAQFKRAVRQPWGIMPAYTETQLPEQRLNDMYAYMMSLPGVATVAQPRIAPPAAGTLAGQVAAIQAVGCAQCHQAEIAQPRAYMGGEGGDYAMFANLVYEHTQTFPMGRMGNYSRQRLPESTLQEIWKFMATDLGLRVPVTAAIDAGVAAGANKTYTLTVSNTGKAGKGLTAEGLTIAVALPAGVTVVSTTGAGYKGVSPAAGSGGTVATWQSPKIAAAEKQMYTLTLSGTADGMFMGSQVRWTTPEIRRPAGLVRQAGLPDAGDAVNVAIARPAATQ